MSHGSPADVVPFERFQEQRQRRARKLAPDDIGVPPASTDPGNAAIHDSEPRTIETTAVARPAPGGTTT